MSIVLLWIAAQVIAESLPVSSSSHIKLLEIFLYRCTGTDFLSALPRYFEEFLHVPNLLVIAAFFFGRWYPLLRYSLRFKKLFFDVVMRAATASFVTVVFYFSLAAFPVKDFFSMGIGLLITALLLFSLKWCDVDNYQPYTLARALCLGAVQGCALLPGISRLASTYVVARWLKLSPRHALEASFAMQVPLMIAAGIRGGIVLMRSSYIHELLNARCGLVIIISSIVAYLGLCVVAYLARVHRLWVFSYYMLVPIMIWLVLTRGGSVLCHF